jgi:hypothetical protein
LENLYTVKPELSTSTLPISVCRSWIFTARLSWALAAPPALLAVAATLVAATLVAATITPASSNGARFICIASKSAGSGRPMTGALSCVNRLP